MKKLGSLFLIMSVFVLLNSTVWSYPFPVPDTGQTTCYNSTNQIICPQPGEPFYGQDAQYTINPPSYVKLDENGNELPASATSWAMVTDKATGLTWEVKTDDGSIHDKDNVYNWQHAQDLFVAQVNTSKFGGHADWRLPSIKELLSIVDLGAYQPAVDSDFFPNTVSSYFWSGTANAHFPDGAWNLDFEDGSVSPASDKNYTNYVRCVRGGSSGTSAPLTNNGDGTVTDKTTGLMWQQATAPGAYSWEEALSYADNLTYAEYNDWRLPNLKELQSITDQETYDPVIDTDYFPITFSAHYWSSSTHVSNPEGAWGVSFGEGEFDEDTKTLDGYVRCVRGGPAEPIAEFTQNVTSGTVPLTVNFADLSTGTLTFWLWDFGDGETSTEQNPTHTYNDLGTYTVSLTATGPAGSDTITRSDLITVTYPVPESDFTAIPTDGTVPLKVDFTSLSTGTITEWLWNFGDGHASTEENPAHIYRIPGTFSVSLTVSNPDGSDTETKTDYIDVFLCSYDPVRITAEYYVSIQEAYDHAFDGDMIQCQSLVFAEDLSFDRDISVTVKGGYDCGYVTNQGDTRIKSMVIGNGTISTEKLTLFTTTASKPTATTGSATSVTSSSATLNGTVNPNGDVTAVMFEYGTTAGYGSEVIAGQSPIDGTTAQGLTSNLTALLPGTIYHFRVKATNSVGTTCGEDEILITFLGRLPDTGQIQSYTTTFGEDSDYLINPPSYTKLDENGNALPDSAATWVMVRDNVTQLVWEVKTNDRSIHDKDNKYNWQKAQDVFVAELNATCFGGHSDWRVPTINELASITDLGRYDPSINTDYFPNTLSSNYWSSTTIAASTGHAWGVGFNRGNGYSNVKSYSYYVRAVRGGQAGSLDHLVINGDGTVTDTITGLMWQQATDGLMSWEAAISYCEALSLSGYDDWRLPNRKELHSIVHYSRYNPAIEISVFPDTSSSYYWSSTTSALNTDYAWNVGFNYGYVYYYYKSNSYYARAVRGGQTRLLGHLVIWAPSQASTWNVGDSMTITWDTKAISGNVKMSISGEGGKDGTFETIAVSTENDGEYIWIVTGPGSVNSMLKIEPLSDPEKGTVQGLFSIVD